jgi:hypothetical protein
MAILYLIGCPPSHQPGPLAGAFPHDGHEHGVEFALRRKRLEGGDDSSASGGSRVRSVAAIIAWLQTHAFVV